MTGFLARWHAWRAYRRSVAGQRREHIAGWGGKHWTSYQRELARERAAKETGWAGWFR